MIETILLALIFAKFRGYRIRPLFKDWPIYIVMMFALIYILLEIAVFNGNYSVVGFSNVYKILYLTAFLALIIRYSLYKSAIVGSVSVLIGGAMNDIAIAANNGKMPVFPTVSYLTGYASPDAFSKVNDIHVLGTSAVNYKFLTDVIDIGYSILSLGDVFIRLFPFIIVLYAAKSCSERDLKQV
ncbi:MAG: hypothetical protein H6Q58_2112 [Firmicutes bacterium]|nr:hypothetical protein [Bacillota bacterium]